MAPEELNFTMQASTLKRMAETCEHILPRLHEIQIHVPVNFMMGTYSAMQVQCAVIITPVSLQPRPHGACLSLCDGVTLAFSMQKLKSPGLWKRTVRTHPLQRHGNQHYEACIFKKSPLIIVIRLQTLICF